MLAHFGLRVLRRARRPGIAALLSLLRIRPETLSEDDVGFMLAPRINAASRMERPETAAQLLATKDSEEAAALARELNRINDERKGVVAATVKEINHRIKGSDILASPVLVMGNPKWRPGVLGLVANNLMEAHGKPVFLWGREGGEIIKGSCRSDGTVSVVDLMAGAGTWGWCSARLRGQGPPGKGIGRGGWRNRQAGRVGRCFARAPRPPAP